jgi:hypothetical protein
MLFLEAESFFEGVAVRLVHFEADVGLSDPVSGDGEWSIFRGNLLDANDDVHGFRPCSKLRLKIELQSNTHPHKTRVGYPRPSTD